MNVYPNELNNDLVSSIFRIVMTSLCFACKYMVFCMPLMCFLHDSLIAGEQNQCRSAKHILCSAEG